MSQPTSPSATAAARLRKTFQYPTDDDDDNSTGAGEALDEEEQTDLITTLQTQNTSTNTLYTRFTLLLTLLVTPLYLPSLFPFISGRSATVLPSLLALTSLACSAYVLVYLPQGSSGIAEIDRWFAASSTKAKGKWKENTSPSFNTDYHQKDVGGNVNAANLPQLGQRIDKSPLELYIPYLNLVLVGVVAVAGWLLRGKGGEGGLSSGEAWSRLGLVPGVVYAVVIVGRGVMGGVEGGIRELEGLRYGFKGA